MIGVDTCDHNVLDIQAHTFFDCLLRFQMHNRHLISIGRCTLRGRHPGDYDHAICMNKSACVVVFAAGEAARVGLKVGDIVYRVNGKRPTIDGVFPPSFTARKARTADEAVLDKDGREIGIIEVSVLRRDVEQLQLFEQRPKRSLDAEIPELAALGVMDSLGEVLKEGESRLSLQERRKFFTRKDQLATRIQKWARQLIFRWRTRATIGRLRHMANVHNPFHASTNAATSRLPPADEALTKQMLQELVNADASMRFLTPAQIASKRQAQRLGSETEFVHGEEKIESDVPVSGTTVSTSDIRSMLSRTGNHYGMAWIALSELEVQFRKRVARSQSSATSSQAVSSANYQLSRPVPCPAPTFILKRGASTALPRRATLRQARREAAQVAERRRELQQWKRETEIETKVRFF